MWNVEVSDACKALMRPIHNYTKLCKVQTYTKSDQSILFSRLKRLSHIEVILDPTLFFQLPFFICFLYRTPTEPLPNLYRTSTKSLPNLYQTSTEPQTKLLPNIYRTSTDPQTELLPNIYRTSPESFPNLYQTFLFAI